MMRRTGDTLPEFLGGSRSLTRDPRGTYSLADLAEHLQEEKIMRRATLRNIVD